MKIGELNPLYIRLSKTPAAQPEKNSAENSRKAKLEDVAKKFEGLFINQLMNEMLKSTSDGLMGEGLQGEIFQTLFVQNLSDQLSSGKGMGLSKIIYEYFERSMMNEESALPGESNE